MSIPNATDRSRSLANQSFAGNPGNSSFISHTSNRMTSAHAISGISRILDNHNRSTGGSDRLVSEAASLMNSLSDRPAPGATGTYLMQSGISREYYVPQLSLGDLLHIGSKHYKRECYEATEASIKARAQGPAYCTIVFPRYRDQAEIIYEKLVQKYPGQNTPLPGWCVYKGSCWDRLCQSWSQDFKNEDLQKRRVEQDQIMANVIRECKNLRDPAIERVYRPSPEEIVEKYNLSPSRAAAWDMVIMTFKLVPFHRGRWQNVPRCVEYPDDPNRVSDPPQAGRNPPSINDPNSVINQQTAREQRSFFSRVWSVIQEFFSWLFSCCD